MPQRNSFSASAMRFFVINKGEEEEEEEEDEEEEEEAMSVFNEFTLLCLGNTKHVVQR